VEHIAFQRPGIVRGLGVGAPKVICTRPISDRFSRSREGWVDLRGASKASNLKRIKQFVRDSASGVIREMIALMSQGVLLRPRNINRGVNRIYSDLGSENELSFVSMGFRHSGLIFQSDVVLCNRLD
jgi:hypothetical protein